MRAMTSTAQTCVVVGVDGSANSLAALHRAASAAVRREAVLDVVYAIGRDERDRLSSSAAVARARIVVESMIASVPQARRASRVRSHVVDGEPARELVRIARDADLLVLGARSAGDRSRPLGGTITAVLDTSPCEVVVCREHAPATRVDAADTL